MKFILLHGLQDNLGNFSVILEKEIDLGILQQLQIV